MKFGFYHLFNDKWAIDKAWLTDQPRHHSAATRSAAAARRRARIAPAQSPAQKRLAMFARWLLHVVTCCYIFHHISILLPSVIIYPHMWWSSDESSISGLWTHHLLDETPLKGDLRRWYFCARLFSIYLATWKHAKMGLGRKYQVLIWMISKLLNYQVPIWMWWVAVKNGTVVLTHTRRFLGLTSEV
jgi:hypothetical protein